MTYWNFFVSFKTVDGINKKFRFVSSVEVFHLTSDFEPAELFSKSNFKPFITITLIHSDSLDFYCIFIFMHKRATQFDLATRTALVLESA